MAETKPTLMLPPDYVRDRYAALLPPEDAAALEFLFTLRETAHRFDALTASWLGRDALTPGRLQVLIVLWARERPVPQREIVAALNVSRANVSVLVEALQKEGHVSTEPGPADRRQVLVSLTQTGRTMTDRLLRDTAGKLRGSLALDDNHLRTLTGLMARVLP